MDAQMSNVSSLVTMSEGDKVRKVADMRARAEHLRNEILHATTESEDSQAEFQHI